MRALVSDNRLEAIAGALIPTPTAIPTGGCTCIVRNTISGWGRLYAPQWDGRKVEVGMSSDASIWENGGTSGYNRFSTTGNPLVMWRLAPSGLTSRLTGMTSGEADATYGATVAGLRLHIDSVLTTWWWPRELTSREGLLAMRWLARRYGIAL